MPTDREWSQQLLSTIPGAVAGKLLGVTAPVANPREKRDLYVKTGAIAVDMESHIVAAVGLAHGIPVAAIRVITDPAQRALPVSAVAAMRPNGTTDIAAMVRSVLKRPREIPALFQTALDARAARASLVRGRYWLEPHFGLEAAG
jgi:adenosylhomocysteine nucleosidase